MTEEKADKIVSTGTMLLTGGFLLWQAVVKPYLDKKDREWREKR